MTETKIFFEIIGLDTDELDIDPQYEETDQIITIYATQKDIYERVCPNCSSRHVIIKGYRTTVVDYSMCRNTLKPIEISLRKIRYVCKDCKKSYTPELQLVQPGKNISRKLEQYVYSKTMEPISFKQIGEEINISTTSVKRIFNDTVKIGRSALTTAISIDEKHFVTDYGKYILIITDTFNGKPLDILPTRKIDYLRDYFRKIPAEERKNVKFVTSDMYEQYRKIIKEFFPKALHIVDHFHISRVFTTAIQIIRKEYMKDEDKYSPEYDFLKTNRKLFLINPYAEETTILDKEAKFRNKYQYMSYKDMIKLTIHKYPKLNDVYSIYNDYCKYLRIGEDDDKLIDGLNFIISRCENSIYKEINDIANTLNSFYVEILNYFTSLNSHKLSNAVAEATNNVIQKFISCSYGLKDFYTFRKRILHANRKGIRNTRIC